MRSMICLMLLALSGCSAPQVSNTRLRSADLVTMSDQMTASLMRESSIASRTAMSPAWIVTLDKVSNRTNDVIPEREKWAFVARLRAQLAQNPVMAQRNVRFVLPPEQAAALNSREAAGTSRATPTHALTATFYAITQAQRTGRTDAYLCAFQLLSLGDDTIVWEDRYEMKRATVRNELD